MTSKENDLSENDELRASTSTKQLKLNHTKFQGDWIMKFSWLETNSSKDRLFCKICRSNNKSNIFAKEGSTNLQKSALDGHNCSIDHQVCVKIELNKTKLQPSVSDLFSVRKDVNQDIILNHFKICYFMAKNNIPINLATNLHSLCKSTGSKTLDHYTDHNSARQVVLSIAQAVDSELLQKVKDADFISILLEESEDEAEKKQLILVVRFALNFTILEKYFCIQEITNATAEGLFKELVNILTIEEIDTQKISSIATDGAQTMLGVHSGLVTLLKNNYPHLKSIHCMNHRLNLAIKDFMKIYCS